MKNNDAISSDYGSSRGRIPAIKDYSNLKENEIISFDAVPAMLAEVNRKLDLLLAGKVNNEEERDRYFSLGELQNYLPDKPAQQTVYGWVNDRKIPFKKHGRRLYFRKSEIDAWLENGRQI